MHITRLFRPEMKATGRAFRQVLEQIAKGEPIDVSRYETREV